MVIITRAQDNKLKQTTLTASLDGSVIIDNSSAMDTGMSTPAPTIRLPGTPGRAHRCSSSQKTLFPPSSARTIVKPLVSELINTVLETIKVTDENGRTPEDAATQDTIEEERDLQAMLLDAMDLSQAPSQSPETQKETPPAGGEDGALLDWYKGRVVDLTRQVLEIGTQSEKLLAHATALENTISLLNKDSDEKMKEIKRLQAEVDKSRLEVSKATGLRRHLDAKGTGKSTKKSKDTTQDTPPTMDSDILRTLEAEFAANRAEMAALKEQIASVLPDEGPFQTVQSRKRRKSPQPSSSQYSSPQYPPQQHSSQNPPMQPPSYADITAQRTPKPTTLSFGTSLARGTKNALRNNNVEAMEYSFPGYQLPELRGEIIPILEKNPQVDKVVITAGGNDCEREGVTLPQIKAEYDALVDAIKIQQGWDCKVIINAVPQRRRATRETRHKIAGLNLEHYYHSDPDKYVYFVDSAPKTAAYFYDRVHLNHHGQDYWARKVAGVISNFQPVIFQTRM